MNDTSQNNLSSNSSSSIQDLNTLVLQLVEELEGMQDKQQNIVSKLHKLVQQIGLLENNEAKLNAKIAEIEKLRAQIQANPHQAEELINSIQLDDTPTTQTTPENTTQRIPPATPQTPPLTAHLETPKSTPSMPSEPMAAVPTTAPTIPDIQLPSNVQYPTQTNTNLSPSQAIVQKLLVTQPTAKHGVLTPDAQVQLAPAGNGIDITANNQTQHFTDAELIQAGCTAEDILALQK